MSQEATVTEQKDKEIEELFRLAPKSVRWVSYLALILGFLGFSQMLWAAKLGQISWGSAVLFGIVHWGVLLLCGASVPARNQWLYFALFLIAAKPLPKCYALAAHLPALLSNGSTANDSISVIASLLAVVRVLVTAVLFSLLLGPQVRRWVFQKKPDAVV